MKRIKIFGCCAFLTVMLFFCNTAGYTQARVTAKSFSNDAIRPFSVNFTGKDIDELLKRVQATRWPDRETVEDRSQGVQLEKLSAMVQYWGTKYNWRNAEKKLNAYPQFITSIDGLDVHFIHARSKHANALPLIITHGWPGSVFELLKVIEPLTNPTAHGGKPEDAFHVVIPSMPGYGFSAKPAGTGWGPERIGRAWDVLMKRIGYKKYVSQGGDWGSVIAGAMGRQAPEGLLGIHLNMPATVPPEIAAALKKGDGPPPSLTSKEIAAYQAMKALYTRGAGYAGIMVTRPQTLAYGLTDSPAGMLAFFYDKFNDWTYSGGDAAKVLTTDEMLDDVTLYWLTNTAASSARLYWENNNNNFNSTDQKTLEIKVPVAISVFPGEIYQAPRSWAERSYPTLMYYNEVSTGGHFAAWEAPAIFSSEIRAAFSKLRKQVGSF
jgi:pimeloyl-ACP methyl ester carboxylesterase